MKRFISALALLLAVAAPAAAQNQNWGNGDGAERLSRLEDEVRRLSQRVSSVPVTGAAASQLDMRLDQLEQQVRTLTGQVEKNQYMVMQLQNRMERMNQDLEVRFSELQRQQQVAQLPPPAVIDGTAPAAPATAADAPAPSTADNPQAMYDEGFGKLRQADYAAAEVIFRQFLDNHPKHPLAGNAAYWLGETYYVRGQFKEAAVTFADGYQKYPKNSKAADNLLKLAMSLHSLGSKDDACLTLTELDTKYPKATDTIRARAAQEKKKMGCK